jgi:hypothetical protein
MNCGLLKVLVFNKSDKEKHTLLINSDGENCDCKRHQPAR